MRKTRVRDLHSAADLGQSSPCSGLSFPTNRPGLTVSIAALAPFGWPFPELEGTPSSSRSPFLRPGLRGRSQKSITAAARYRRARLAGGVDARRIVAARGRPFGNAPWGCSARPSRTGTGGLTWIPTCPACAFLSASRRSQSGRRVGKAASPRPPHPYANADPVHARGRPSGVPEVFRQDVAGTTGWATPKPACPERTTGGAGAPWLRQPPQLLSPCKLRPLLIQIPSICCLPGVGAPTTTSKGLSRLCSRETYPVGAISSGPCVCRGPPLVLPRLAGSPPWRSHC